MRGLFLIGLHLLTVGVGLTMYALMFPALWVCVHLPGGDRWGDRHA